MTVFTLKENTKTIPTKALGMTVVLSTSLLAACSDSNDSSMGASMDAVDTSTGTVISQGVADTTSDASMPTSPTLSTPTVTTPTVSTPAVTELPVANDQSNNVELSDQSSTPVTNTTEVTQPVQTSTPEPETPTTVEAEPEQTPTPQTINPPNTDTGLVPASVTGSDTSGSDDDSPTATESASLAFPFFKDTNRPNGPPSVPEGLTLLMAGENFVEMSWIPSSDDQSVEGYEIYRDGTLVYTVRGDTNFEFDYKSWITTSYMDCNYTRYSCADHPIAPGSSYSYQVAALDNEGMRSALSEPVVFQMAQALSGGPDLTGYQPVFNEEFEGDSLDRDLWKTSLPWGENEIVNSEQQYFVNLFGSDPLPINPYVMTGSTLQITGSVTPSEYLSRANNQPYLSGVITTKDKFAMTYGYIETKAKLVAGNGFLSTFFLFNQDFEKNKPEIDVIEYIGDRPDKAYQTYHYFDSVRHRWADGERHSTPTMEAVLGDLSTDFHTYSVLWEPELIVWYIDGNEVQRITGPRVSDEPMNLVAQLVIGSEWIGSPDASQLPQSLEIDYIKAWQKP